MSYTYLLDLYSLIEKRTGQATARIQSGCLHDSAVEFQRGRLEMLRQFRIFLTDNYNSKLPRRIRRNFSVKG
ncbi:MAG: hypothetical protein DSY70_09075 [Desulfobulbus sp.]|nr:MAG: hypothetical protein DSY70_09075 [Desulfobulbus sp.]